jgi:uridine phosphorylase
LDSPPQTVETDNPIANSSLFELYSERGFLTLSGTYKSVPVSIVSIGMGAPNMDFFVREAREVLDESGEKNMVVIR